MTKCGNLYCRGKVRYTVSDPYHSGLCTYHAWVWALLNWTIPTVLWPFSLTD